MLGEEFLYKTPFVNARLNDDEIAVGSLLMGMHEYLKNGKEIYSLADALQDMYLCLKMEEANGLTNINRYIRKNSHGILF